MRSNEHTPGPWRCDMWQIGPNTHNISIRHEDGLFIESNEANARLIAAAPEMLEFIVNECKCYCEDCHRGKCDRCELIIKAKGETAMDISKEPAQTLVIEGVREEVKGFAIAMENKLRKHDNERGDSWETCSVVELRDFLKDELRELEEAIDNCDGVNAAWEAVDVANFAMFIRTVIMRRKTS